MLERIRSVLVTKIEPVVDKILPQDRKNAIEFVHLANEILGKDLRLLHFNNLEVYFDLKEDGNKRYFLKEGLFENGKSYEDYYITSGTRVIYKRLNFGEILSSVEGKIIGKKVTSEMMQGVKTKLQKVKSPLG